MARREDQATTAAVMERAESAARERAIPARIVRLLLALLLLVGAAIGAWWLWGRDAAPTAGGDDASVVLEPSPPGELATAPVSDDPLPLARLDGAAESHPGAKQFADVESLGYLDDNEVATYTAAGAADARFHGQRMQDNCTARILLASASSVAAATTAAESLANLHIKDGAGRLSGPFKNGHITALGGKGNGAGQIEAHYAAGNVIVRIDVRNADGLPRARPCFDTLLAAQLAALPANA